MTKYSLALIPLLMASTAIAGPATEEGAAHLTEVFQTYLGSTEGVVSVEIDGEDYAVTLDGSILMAGLAMNGAEFTTSPIEMTLTDNGDGTWGVSQDQAFSIITKDGMGGEGKQDIAKLTMEGVFDESLMIMTSSTGTLEGLKQVQTQTMPDGSTLTSEMIVEMTTASSTAVAGASGGADGEVKYDSTGISMTMSMPQGEGMPAMPIAIKAASANYAGKLTGLRSEGILGILAFFVAHPDEAAIKGAKDEAKAAITAALPLWNNILVDGKVSGVTAETPVGPVALDEVTFTVDLNGAVTEGKFREAFSVSGLTLPPGLVPDWAAPILPQKVSIDFQATGFDAAAGVTALLGAFDLPEDGMADTTAFDAAVEKGFLPNGTVQVSINPSAITGDGYELTYQGDMTVDIASEMPSGKALVTLTGADKLQAAINGAPEDMKMQAMMGFGMAQGMAKQEGDKLIWEIDATNPMNPLINGVSMMGGQ
ncbi:hypothetical protein [Stagnihabitans tardus]|uniref:DUF2125 domain-containing protein n=1 Tax=Stagnihabitans tardus TaxID=2699202 RepID=A0AAE5BW81_9RHOB|nr:hypothetical protein [Stagnihabitans tardus]NBZ88038.1 hypothetical protein [Stagnihabitans tardus]